MSRLLSPISRRRDSTEGSLSREEIFEILSNERRQCALHYLINDGNEPVDLRELVDYVAAWENDAKEGTISGDERKRVYTALRQSHLPRLEEAGLIEYERQFGSVQPTDAAEDLRMYLEFTPGSSMPWSLYYLGLAAASVAFVAVSWSGVSPFGTLSGFVVAAVIVIAFAILAAIHGYTTEFTRIGRDRFELPKH